MATVEALSARFFPLGDDLARRLRGPVSFVRSGAALIVAGGSFLYGCASAELAPITPNTDGAAIARTSSVEVRAQVRPAHPDVPSSLVPIELSVKNLAPGAISVALRDIQLVAADGSAQAILPETIPLRRPMGLGIDPASPFATSGAATSGPTSAGPGRESGGPVFEPSETYALGHDADPRRRELIDGAFTGGAIESGGTQRGTIYFDTENIEADRVNLRVVVRAGSDRGVAQVLEIPFTVQS